MLITGASSGIGAATARAASSKYRLVLAATAIGESLRAEQPAGVDINEILIRPTTQPI